MDIFAIITITILALVLLIGLGWGILCQCVFGLQSPRQLFKGHLTNKEFTALLYILYSASDLEYDGYRLKGGGYECWVANDMYGFNINGSKDFSLYQRVKFFYYYKKVLKMARDKKTAEALKKHQLTPNGMLLYKDEE